MEIVAKLLSVSLIGNELEQTNEEIVDQCLDVNFDQSRETEPESELAPSLESEAVNRHSQDQDQGQDQLQQSFAMVYSSTSFLKIREEYPNLDKEVRSLLLAHAQEGATIAEIKGKRCTFLNEYIISKSNKYVSDDYYKLTGVNFPDFENITDYFLSIPNVVAYCTEHGTRVFNILPLDKTKHLYNMVMDQRPQNKDLGNYQRHVMRSKNLRNATNTISGYPLNTQNNNIAHHYFPTPLAHCNQKRKNYVLSAMESDQEFCLYSDMLDKNGNCTKTSVQLEANKKNINGESNLNRPAFFNRNITTKYNCDDKCL